MICQNKRILYTLNSLYEALGFKDLTKSMGTSLINIYTNAKHQDHVCAKQID